MSFSADIASFAKKANASTLEARDAIILELFSSVIKDTPVDTGRLRGNWQITTDAPAKGESNLLDPSGSTVVRQITQALGNEVVYMTNNLPYAYRIEYDGYSNKAPEGMVRKNFARVQRIIKEAVN